MGFFVFKLFLVGAILFGGISYFIKATPAASTTYYISDTGDDTHVGTSIETAWKTIKKVNQIAFQSGDTILFEGGQTFTGGLEFDSDDLGSAANRITVSSYGTGKATVYSNTAEGISLYNTAGFNVSNINFLGSGPTTNTQNGISIYMDLNNQKLEGITIDGVEVSGYGKWGGSIGSWNNFSGFKNVQVLNSSFYNNKSAGFGTFSQSFPGHENFLVRNSKFYNNLGDPASAKNTGSGIVFGGVNGGVIEKSVAYNNGINCFANECGVGIWAYDSNNITLQFNESYSNRTSSFVDGDGFDFDQNVANSVMQYNYSHNNDGAGYLIAHSLSNRNHKNNTIRYNISENDSRKLTSYGAIHVWGGVDNLHIYNNTVYISPNSSGSAPALALINTGIENQKVNGFFVRNNNFISSGTSSLANIAASQTGGQNIVFQGNNYYSTSGGPIINWAGSSFSTLGDWQNSTGQEKLNGVAVGSTVDPKMVNSGGGGTINNPDELVNLEAYKLLSNSPLREAGLDLPLLFGINVGNRDFYGMTVPVGGKYDTGAAEFPTAPVSPTPTPTPTVTPTLTPGTTYIQSGSVSAADAVVGSKITLNSKFTASKRSVVLVNVEVIGNQGKVFQVTRDNQTLLANTQKSYSSSWNTAGLPVGTYSMYHGLWTPGWGSGILWVKVADINLTAPVLSFTVSSSGTPTTAKAGSVVKLNSSFTPSINTTVLTDIEVWSSTSRVYQSINDNQTVTANVAKKYTNNWNTAGLAKGTYTMYQGVWTPGWGTNIVWKQAQTIKLQ
jgi:hypothetical protein